ncbi:19388_t:CDS:2 [Funneliformis geosporum]|nr:19388_t:CDS:2 [Funneliformis geosporum]
MEEKCEHYLNFHKDDIWHNVDIFLKCLNAEKDDKDLNKDDQENDNDQDNTADKNDLEGENSIRLNMSEREILELELQNKIIDINNCF